MINSIHIFSQLACIETELMCDFGQELEQWLARMFSVISASQHRLPDFRVDWGQNVENTLYIITATSHVHVGYSNKTENNSTTWRQKNRPYVKNHANLRD